MITEQPTTSLTEAVNNVLRWRPNPGKQERALRIPDNVFEVLYGGARGGGKTDAGIYWMIKPIEQLGWQPTVTHPLFRGLVLRRSAKDLNDWLDRASRVYKAYGAKLVKSPQTVFTFPSGAKIIVGHLKDVSAYLGHEYQRILIEELTQIKDELTYTKLLGSCRSTITDLSGNTLVRPQIFMTTNPGGKGHGWVRRRFVSAAPWDTFFMNPATNRWAIFIPSSVKDNPKLTEADPGYVQWLEGIRFTDEKLYRMWALGEWDAFEGQVFTEWRYQLDGRPHHVFDRFWFDISKMERITGFDWGMRDPASMHWIARLPANEYGVEHLIIYREVYQGNTPARRWGELMGNVQKIDPVRYMVLPHDCFSTRPDGSTVADSMKAGIRKVIGKTIPIKQAESLKHGSRLNRVSLMHDLLATSPDGYPYLMIHSSCSNLIRTLPELVYDETIVEEIDDDAEDHAFDSATYGLTTLKPRFAAGDLVKIGGRQPSLMQPGYKATPQGGFAMDNFLQQVAASQVRPSGRPEV